MLNYAAAVILAALAATQPAEGPMCQSEPEPPVAVCPSRPCLAHAALMGEIFDKTADDVERGMKRLRQDPHPDALLLLIGSAGGKYDASLRIYRAIRSAPVPVYCYVAQASSGAFLVLQACTERAAAKDSYLMSHSGAWFVTEPMAIGLDEMARDLASLRALELEMAGLIAPRLGLTVGALRARWAGDKDWELTGAQGLAARALDVLDDDPTHYMRSVLERLGATFTSP